MRIADEDITSAARIRDAAVRCFASSGFDASLRTIADEAGVSLGLIRHHFGSKDGLRAACDERVLWLMDELGREKTHAVSPVDAAFAAMAERPELEPAVLYLVRGLADGGSFSRKVVDQMTDALEEYLERGAAEGTIRPSRDNHARARYLVLSGVGAMLLHFMQSGDWSQSAWRDFTEATTAASLELYTHGLLASSDMLDAYEALTRNHAKGGDA